MKHTFLEKKTVRETRRSSYILAKAVRQWQRSDVRIGRREVPEVQPHQVKVAVKFAGSGTDLHEYLMDFRIFNPQPTNGVFWPKKHPVTVLLESSGEIVALEVM